MISKLKYLGTKTEDLIDIYCLYVRSVLEYCSVVFHSSLTAEQSDLLESVQSAALFSILGDNFVSSSAAREMAGLDLLSERRERRVEAFTRKSLKHPRHSNLFPRNVIESDREVRYREPFKVNFARTEFYRKSALIKCQNKANQMFAEGRLKLD